MPEFHVDVVIERPVEEVFAFATEPSNVPKWQSSVVEMKKVTEGPVDVGTKASVVREFLGRRIETTEEVVEYVPHSRFMLKSAAGPVPFTVTSDFEPVGGGTRFEVTIDADPSGLFQLAGPLFARRAKKELESNLGHLKKLLEARADRE